MAKELVLKEGEVDARGIVPINRQTLKDKLRAYLKKPFSFAALLLILLASLATAAIVVWILVYVLMQGIPYLKPSMFEWRWSFSNMSMLPSLINTLVISLISIAIAGVIGVFAAIFMVEYAKSTNIFVKIVRVAAETLSGIPSIVFGIFGMVFFVELLGWGYTLLGGALTMTMMILPLVMRTTEEALLAVPDSFREGSYALGAGKLRTIFVIILPSAIPGIVSGVILGLGRVVGETMALVYTAGSAFNIRYAAEPMSQGCTLTVYMYSLINEGNKYAGQAWAVAVVLIVLVIIINGAAEFIGNKLKKEY
mgnify:CR=1 FL=1